MSDGGESGVCDECIEACCCAVILDAIGGKTVIRIVCFLLAFAVLATGFTLLVIAFVARPVGVAVEDAALARLAIAVKNDTTTALAYDVSLAVAVYNHNWLMRAEYTAPLDAELLFAGAHFARVALAGAGSVVRPGDMEVYHATAAADSAGVALGSSGVVEFLRESTEGVFQLELKVVGLVRYPPRKYLHRLDAICPLELAVSTATSPAIFRKVKCAVYTR